MKKLEVRLATAPGEERTVGTLAEQRGIVFFEYDEGFLRDGLELSPFKLPRAPGLFEHRDQSFGPLPGLFDQSLPDGWGLLLMDRHFRRAQLDPGALSPLDRLAYLGRRTMGALTYHPSAEPDLPESIDLGELGLHAEAVFEGRAEDVLPALIRAGGSPGGARPKVLVGVRGDELVSGETTLAPDFEPWLVKFAAKNDVESAGPIEYAYALMAEAAGVPMPETRLFEVEGQGAARRYFGVRRFDRAPGGRVHVQSLGCLLHSDFRIPNLDYSQLLKVTALLTQNHEDVIAAFRQMVFNVAAHIRDDHAKNFSFFIKDDVWRLTPAYDLTFTHGPGGEHTMTVDGEGREPSAEHCLRIAQLAGIGPRVARTIFEQVNEAVVGWGRFAEQAHCPESAADAVAGKLRRL